MTNNDNKTIEDISGNVIEKNSDEFDKTKQDTTLNVKEKQSKSCSINIRLLLSRENKMLRKTIVFLNDRTVRAFLFILILCFLFVSAEEYCMRLYMILWFFISHLLSFVGFSNTILTIICSIFLLVMFLIILSTIFIFLPLFGLKLFINRKQDEEVNINKHSKPSVKKIYIIPLFIPLAILIIVCGLNYSGFCFKKMRWLSEENKTQILISSIIKNQKDYTTINGVKKRLIKYNNVQEFLTINPGFVVFDCQDSPSFWRDYDGCPKVFTNLKLRGKAADTAFFSYLKRYENEDGSIGYETFAKGIVVITNCGEFVEVEWSEIFR
ncbi:MAG: hypothetical protein AB7U85_05135 [Alphaproteobacteria bacterium]